MPNGFNMITLSTGGNDSINTNFDEIRLGTDWKSVSYTLAATSVSKKELTSPSKFALLQNYPNPFNPSTNIAFTLNKAGNTRLTVFDILGRQVAVLVDGMQTEGQHTVTFNASRFASGVYFYRLESAGTVVAKKMVLMK
jgi:hypothetical protein